MANVAAHFAESESRASEPTRQPRREQRVASAFRVEVCGFNRHGRFFTERTLTSNISDGGCQLSLHVEVERIPSWRSESSNVETVANSIRVRCFSRWKEWSLKHRAGLWVSQNCSRCPYGALTLRSRHFSHRLAKSSRLPPNPFHTFRASLVLRLDPTRLRRRLNFLLYFRTVSAGDTHGLIHPGRSSCEC